MSVSIDLIICTYNNAPVLDRALAAIAAQDVSSSVNWQVLVVNNNCTDHTVSVVEQHQQAGKIPGLRMITESRQGLNFARACGVQSTSGSWIAFVDDDCLLKPDWVEQAAAFAAAHPDCGAFGGQVILDWEVPPADFVLKFGYSFAEQKHGPDAKPVGCLVGAGMVIRRSALLDIGWLNQQFLADRIGKKLVSGGDVELALRLGSRYPLWYTPNCRLMHLIPPRRTSTNYLIKINYGLGISQILGDSMLWSGSYPSWVTTCIRETLPASHRGIVNSLKAFLGRRSLPEVMIEGSFVLGRWAGIWRLLWMNFQQRQALLGCATPRVQSPLRVEV